MEKLKVGVLGCGKMGRVHAHWFSRHPMCEVTAFFNRTTSVAEEMAKQYPGSKVFESWQELLCCADVDIVTLTTPQYERLQQHKLALQNDKHVFCEKPIAMNIDECAEIIDLSRNSKCKTFVDFQLVYHPVIIRINELIKKIGRIYYIDLDYSMYRAEVKWKHKLEAGGGVLRELGGHFIDLLNLWLGEADSVTGFNRITNSKREVEDLSINIIEYSSGAVAKLTTHYLDRSKRTYQGKIFGEDGQIDFQFSSYDTSDSYVLYYDAAGKVSSELGNTSDIEQDLVYPGFFDCFKKMVDAFIFSIEHNKSLEYSLENECKTMGIINASYESQRKRKIIKLPMHAFNISTLKECFKTLFQM